MNPKIEKEIEKLEKDLRIEGLNKEYILLIVRRIASLAYEEGRNALKSGNMYKVSGHMYNCICQSCRDGIT